MVNINHKQKALSLVKMVISTSHYDVKFLDALNSGSNTPGRVLKKSAQNTIDTAVKDEATLLIILDKVNECIYQENKPILTTPEKNCFDKWFNFLLEKRKSKYGNQENDNQNNEINDSYKLFLSIFDIK